MKCPNCNADLPKLKHIKCPYCDSELILVIKVSEELLENKKGKDYKKFRKELDEKETE